ncbi:RidA family protein [Virgibacillus pantothenticus]|uniref:Endoribonuclease n=1 Tax=Virgibacillus pantothenticus TaxID=1473 RepID=A0A0L0QTH4_VIRPA|nr:RidA family protein [Virgibacillus pantothenticus]KNE21876.1 endoribonuclease [Virgibacillus pantothenticus]MED3738055.1 RidA family protein [Virgibacillus pantothenticus]QTY17120.1 RidA family protein [Virgibacillus pantothenticus]SIS90681.1 Enamine deaminase RidA, house cleaning of reactive enamine intermediates, YjgF/YER057c/UK114 family [Virgibacillus pantothenticus]
MKTARNPKSVHSPVAPYVHQIEVSNPMRWLTISGQLGMDVDGNVPENPLEQLKLTFQNIKNNLLKANMEIKDNTKLVFYLVGEIDATERKKVISDFLEDHLPCTTMVYVVALAAPQFKVEIDAWACKEA